MPRSEALAEVLVLAEALVLADSAAGRLWVRRRARGFSVARFACIVGAKLNVSFGPDSV